MAKTRETAEADLLDPEIRRFVDEVSAGFATHPDFASGDAEDARRIAEIVRRPWREGGPEMAATCEFPAPAGSGVRLRIHYPEQAPEAGGALTPVLIYLHGGGWTLFSIDTHDRLMREYAARSGLVVVGVDYPLSPEAKFPSALVEIGAVVRWLGEDGAVFGLDRERLFLGGDSAGANLAIASALKLRDQGEEGVVKGLLLNYGAYTTSCSQEAAERFGGAGYMLGAEEMDGYWANYLRGPEDASDPYACPMEARLEGLPPSFLAAAECDVLAEQSLAMGARLKAAGVEAELAVYPGAAHSFLEAVSISALADRAISEASQWLRRQAERGCGENVTLRKQSGLVA
jgi:acetyl esterase